MPIPYAGIAAGVSIASTVSGMLSGKEAEKQARQLAREQARQTFAQRQEEIRRTKLGQAQELGYNKAAIGASNIQFGGSAKRHLDQVRTEFARDIAWRGHSARKEEHAIRSGAVQSSNLGNALQGGSRIADTVLSYMNSRPAK